MSEPTQAASVSYESPDEIHRFAAPAALLATEKRPFAARIVRLGKDATLDLGPDDLVFHLRSGVDGQWGYFHEFTVLSPVVTQAVRSPEAGS